MLQGRSINEVQVSAVVTRADGTTEDLGVISTYKKKMKIFSFLRKLFSKKK